AASFSISSSCTAERGRPKGRIWFICMPRDQAATPPRKEWFSISSVFTPVRAAPSAAPIPAGPPPTTSTSTESRMGCPDRGAAGAAWPISFPALALPAAARPAGTNLRREILSMTCVLLWLVPRPPQRVYCNSDRRARGTPLASGIPHRHYAPRAVQASLVHRRGAPHRLRQREGVRRVAWRKPDVDLRLLRLGLELPPPHVVDGRPPQGLRARYRHGPRHCPIGGNRDIQDHAAFHFGAQGLRRIDRGGGGQKRRTALIGDGHHGMPRERVHRLRRPRGQVQHHHVHQRRRERNRYPTQSRPAYSLLPGRVQPPVSDRAIREARLGLELTQRQGFAPAFTGGTNGCCIAATRRYGRQVRRPGL